MAIGCGQSTFWGRDGKSNYFEGDREEALNIVESYIVILVACLTLFAGVVRVVHTWLIAKIPVQALLHLGLWSRLSSLWSCHKILETLQSFQNSLNSWSEELTRFISSDELIFFSKDSESLFGIEQYLVRINSQFLPWKIQKYVNWN